MDTSPTESSAEPSGDPGAGVPMVVLPHPPRTAPYRLSAPLCERWTDARQALSTLLDRIEAGLPLDKPIRVAADSTRALASAMIAAVACPAPHELPPPVRVHSDYFRVRHAPLTPAQQLTQAAVMIHRSVVDLRLTMLDLNDVLAEVRGMVVVLDLLRPEPGGAAAIPVTGPALWEPTGDWLDRWFLAHHLYFLFNVYAAAELKRATTEVVTGSEDAAGTTLARAAELVRAFTAGMLHSGAMTARYYLEVVRPTMSPPHVPVNLTGVMQLEHRRYRAALNQLLAALPEPHDALHARHPELAATRDELLEADLVDMERHVIVAAVLVGGERSLVQPGTTTQNATSTLRKMRHMRAASYRDMMRFGDTWTGGHDTPATVPQSDGRSGG